MGLLIQQPKKKFVLLLNCRLKLALIGQAVVKAKNQLDCLLNRDLRRFSQ